MKTLNIKDKSVYNFLKERMVDFQESRDTNPYSLFRDELIFKRDCGIAIGERLNIEMYDHGEGSGKKLINHYQYLAESYDDISIRMTLVDFKVKAISFKL